MIYRNYYIVPYEAGKWEYDGKDWASVREGRKPSRYAVYEIESMWDEEEGEYNHLYVFTAPTIEEVKRRIDVIGEAM